MSNLDSIFKSRDITLPTKVCLVKAMVFPVVMYGCASWTVKKAERWRIDAFGTVVLDLLAVQGTLKSLLQHRNSKASVLQCSAFFVVQLSHPYITNGKTIALTKQTLVGKVMSLLFNMLSRLVIAFLPRNQHLLISWLQYHPEWFWGPKIKSVTVSSEKNTHLFLIYLPWSDGTWCHDLSFLNVEL